MSADGVSAVGSVIGAVGGLAGFVSLYFQRKDSVKQTKFRVAPYVFCNVEGFANVGDDAGATTRFITTFDYEFGKELFMIWDANDIRTEIPAGPLAHYVVQVTNSSDEPVAGTILKVLNPLTNEPVPTQHPIGLGTLNPKSSKQVSIHVPREWKPEFTHQARIQMTFTDSAGQSWKRIDTDPPTEDD